MTAREFHDIVTAMLDVRTFEPFVVVGVNGSVVHVDHPDELKFTTPGRYRLKRQREEGDGVLIDLKDVARVERLEGYTGGEGLRYLKFRDTLRSLLRAEPFAPFEIELRDANTLRVNAPNRLAMSGRFATLIDLPRPFVVFSDADVVRITPAEVLANAG